MSKNSIIVDNNQRPQEAEYRESKFAIWALIFIVGYFLCEALFVSFISNGGSLDVG